MLHYNNNHSTLTCLEPMDVQNWWCHLAVSDGLVVFSREVQYSASFSELSDIIDGVAVFSSASTEILDSVWGRVQGELIIGHLNRNNKLLFYI